MSPSIRFPSEKEKLLRDIAEHCGKSADYKLRASFELSALCHDLRAASDVRERQMRLMDENEQLGRTRMRAFIKEHVSSRK